ncbi:MAG TPA: DMT family transporter, partial [Acetobacteraceae bacterium]|nr:DMT family transporter [Acetobacteraceae bacterium]
PLPPAGEGDAADRIPPIALIQLATAVVLLGASWPITRFALLQGAGATWFALGRAGLGALVAAAALAALGRLRLPSRRDLPALLALGLLQLAAFFAFAHAAVAWVPAGRTAILANCTITFTVPLSLIVLHEAIPPRRWAATGLGAAGVVALMGPWAIDWSAPNILLGHAFLMGAALSWAVAMLVVRRFPPRMSMLELLPWAFFLATLALLPMALAHDLGHWNGASLLCVLLIGLVIAPAGTWCIMQATTMLPMVVASVGFLAGPAVGVILATLFLHETLGPDLLIGAALILAGAALASSGGRGA